LESFLPLLGLLYPLLLQVLHALRLLSEEICPAQEDVLGKPRIVVLEAHQTIRHLLSAFTKGIEHAPGGFLNLLL